MKEMRTLNGYEIVDKKARDEKIPLPKDSEGAPQTGVAGQVLESAGDGTTRWVDITVTTESITNALGYKPADQEDVSKLFKNVNTQVTELKGDLSQLSATIADLNGGTPTPVSLVSEMTDTKKVYLYTGTEEGYINGNFYYHNGTTWESGGRYGGETGITTALQTALLNCFAYVAWTGDKGKELYDALEMELKKVTANIKIIGISATYTGDDVEAGTQIANLTGITVYVNYSDGSRVVVGSGYELSGEIAEGENTITVTYNGYTTTFNVTGLPSSKVYLTFDANNGATNNTKYYSDDGETEYSNGNSSFYYDPNQPLYDRDVNVHFRCKANLATTMYQYPRLGSYDEENKTHYRVKNALDYYIEGTHPSYAGAGNVYEGVYTLKAGCYFSPAFWGKNNDTALDLTDCYFYIEESEVI